MESGPSQTALGQAHYALEPLASDFAMPPPGYRGHACFPHIVSVACPSLLGAGVRIRRAYASPLQQASEIALQDGVI